MSIIDPKSKAIGASDLGYDEFSLPYFNLLFELQTDERFSLSEFMGSALRGAYGHAFRRICCNGRRCSGVTSCAVASSCPYARSFEPKAVHFGHQLNRYGEVPRPYVVVAPSGPRDVSQFTFGMRVFGTACSYLPYFIYSWIAAGETGITGMRTRFELRQVWHFPLQNDTPTRCFAMGELLPSVPSSCQDLLLVPAECQGVRLRFTSPLRLVHQGKLQTEITFRAVVEAAIRRASAMVRFWGTGMLPDLRLLLSQADCVPLERSSIQWREIERWSNRQLKRLKLSGLQGEAVFEGELNRFVPVLKLGSLLGIGKATAFGLGQYQVEVL